MLLLQPTGPFLSAKTLKMLEYCIFLQTLDQAAGERQMSQQTWYIRDRGLLCGAPSVPGAVHWLLSASLGV